MKRKLTRYIKELATCGTNIDPDHYKANIALQEARIIPSYINDIIGWDGKGTIGKIIFQSYPCSN